MRRSEQVVARDAVFVALGTAMVLAAVLRSHDIYSEPMSAREAFGSVAVLVIQLFLGTCFVIAPRTLWLWRAASLLFFALAVASALKVIDGASSCGCFGTLQISPWITFSFDILALVLLAFCAVDTTPQHGGFLHAASIAFGLSLLVTTISLSGHFRFDATDGANASAGQLIVLEPELWLGKRWPLLTEININSELASGEWDVLLFRHDCEMCHDVMWELEDLLVRQVLDRRIALVGLDTLAGDLQLQRLRELGCQTDFLPQDREWFMTTPLRMRLHDGVCVAAVTIEHWD